MDPGWIPQLIPLLFPVFPLETSLEEEGGDGVGVAVVGGEVCGGGGGGSGRVKGRGCLGGGGFGDMEGWRY